MLRNLHKSLSLLCLFATILLAACSPSPGPAAPTPTGDAATLTATEPAATQPPPGPSPTITPSPTPRSSATQTPFPSPTPEPTTRRGGTINIFCLSVTQAIEGSDAQPAEAISETLGRVLAGAGLTFVPDSQACDAVLALDFTFTAQGYEYQSEEGSQAIICYTGASLRGTADLSFQGSALYHRDLHDEYMPAGDISTCPNPEDAPFDRVWPAAAMNALAEIWGKNVLVPALMDPFRAVREAGAESLYLLSPEEILDFLPFLATAMEDDSEVVRLRTLEALQRALLLEIEPVAALTPQLLDLLAAEWHPEAAQRAVDLLVHLAKDGGQAEVVSAGLGQVLAESPPYPEGMIPNLMILDGIQDLGPLALETAPALITLLADANDPAYAQNIQAVLKAVSGQGFGPDAAAWQAWWDQQN